MTRSFWKGRMPCAPRVWWDVTERRQFGIEPLSIRQSWRVGRYSLVLIERAAALLKHAQ